MLDKLSRDFLDFLSSQPGKTFSYLDDAEYPEKFGNTDDLFAMVQHLEEAGYVESIRTSSDCVIGVMLTHKGVHRLEHAIYGVKSYVLDKWIDFLALIIALIALIRTL